jgi:hypothetical protein
MLNSLISFPRILFTSFATRFLTPSAKIGVNAFARTFPMNVASSVRETADRFDEKIDEQARTQRKLAPEWV